MNMKQRDTREEKRMTGEVCAPPCAVPAISTPVLAERDRVANFACLGNKDGRGRVKGKKIKRLLGGPHMSEV